MKIKLTTAPSIEPVTQAQIEAQLRLGSGFQSDRTDNIRATARQIVELETSRALITQAWTIKMNKWPDKEVIHLPKNPVLSITSFTYLDVNGDSQPLASGTDYVLNNSSQDEATITPIDGWPTLFSSDERDTITIVVSCGYGANASDVPAWAKEAILVKSTELYTAGGVKTSDTYRSIIGPNRIYFDYAINH